MVAFKGIWTQQFWKAVSGEFVAMVIFQLLSLGSTVNWHVGDSIERTDVLRISLCFGFSIVTVVHCFGHISGAHLNPAVTIALVCTRKITLAKAVFYIIAQCLGAISGAGLLYLITPLNVIGNLGVTKVNESLSIGCGVLIELIITFQLVFTISAACDPKNKNKQPLVIGISVMIGHLFAINFTGASMNPARSLGPAVILWKWENHWIYWIGPIIGAVCAGAAYDYIYCPDVELKQHIKDALKNATQKTKGKYIEVELDEDRIQLNTDDLFLKTRPIHVIDIDQLERKKGKDSASEILSTV